MEKERFERYVEMYTKNVFGTALCYVRNTSDADDIVQEVFIKLYTHKGSFESDEHVKAWLLRCAVNQSKSLLRSYWYRFSDPLEKAGDKVHSDKKDSEKLLEIMSRLDCKTHLVLYMYYFEGYSAKEIAGMTHFTENAVMHRLSRGRKRLKELLSQERIDLDDEL